MIEIIVNLHNYLVNFCKKYSEKYGDCYECPIGKQIKEYCKIDGAIRFLENIIRNFKPLKKSELNKEAILTPKKQINVIDTQFRHGDLIISTTSQTISDLDLNNEAWGKTETMKDMRKIIKGVKDKNAQHIILSLFKKITQRNMFLRNLGLFNEYLEFEKERNKKRS